jgi:ribonuclease R
MQFAEPLIALMKRRDYVPLPLPRVAEKLKVPKDGMDSFDADVRELLRTGSIVKLKKDRLCLPRDADLVTGRIKFRQSGSALLIMSRSEEDGQDPEPIQISAEDTGGHARRPRARAPDPHSGRYKSRRDANGKTRAQPDGVNGKVIRILERARETLTGTLRKSRAAFYVIPDDPRITQDILVPDPAASGLKPRPQLEDKVVVKLAEWTQRHLNPEGEIVEVLGKTHTPGAEYRALLHQYNLDPEFPEAVLGEVERLPKRVPAADRQNRQDLRRKHVFTIDPDDAKDFDDALHIEAGPDGGWIVGVHIADVAFYVSPGTALDKEAHRRGNSTYLVGKVIPMLPHQLSNGLCSLVEAEDRLTKSVFLTFNKSGQLVATKTTFANSVIRSAKRLTYRQAYALMFQDDKDVIRALPLPAAHQTGSTGRALSEMNNKELAALQADVRALWHLASKLRRKRMASGSLDLDMPETKIFVDKDGYADRIEVIENDESHQLIEEFMLCANEAVARTLRHAKLPLIHRVHDKPDPEKLEELSEYMGTMGIQAGDLTNRKHVTKLLEDIRKHPQGHILRIQFLRSLKQACYRADPDGHYGLNKTNYTHSPRRSAVIPISSSIGSSTRGWRSTAHPARPRSRSTTTRGSSTAWPSMSQSRSRTAPRPSASP